MAGTPEINELSRIEDFIALARKGKTISATIALRKQLAAQKVHPDATEEMRDEIEIYLLIADYTFSLRQDTGEVSKVYVYGSTGESLNEVKINLSIANERLKMDYKRLQQAHIKFEERYFPRT
jgi:hypothetical protein